MRREPGYLIPGTSGWQQLATGEAVAVEARRRPGYVLVTIAGEVDIATVARLRGQLRAVAADGCPVVADLDRVSFIDAAGLGLLAAAAGRAAT